MSIIQAGRVTVRGETVAEPSYAVAADAADVCLDGQPVVSQAYRYIALHKPRGYVTTKEDRFASRKAADLLPPGFQGLNSVGRLDKDTEGLLLFTNDGDLLHALTHPSFDVGKVYSVRVRGAVTLAERKRLEGGGIVLDRKRTAPAEVRRVHVKKDKTEFEIVLHEGRKRQVRRMCAAIGHPVESLVRLQHGPVHLGRLARGQWRELTDKEVQALREAVQASGR